MTTPRRRPARLMSVRVAAVGLLAAAAAAAAPAVASAQALSQVPADALVVVKVKQLDLFGNAGKVSTLLQQLGIVDLQPKAKDPLKAFTDQTGIPPAALDAKRDAAMYVPNMPPKADAAADEDEDVKPVVVLLPVADYPALVASMADAKTENGITTGHFKDAPNDMYVAHWGEYAALTPTKSLLSMAHAGMSPTGVAAREMDADDLCAYVNFPALKKVLLPELAKGRGKVKEEATKRMADADAAKKDLASTAIDQGFNIVERFLQDAEPTTIGLNIGKAGVSSRMIVAFAKGSYLGDSIGQLKSTSDPLLAGLPEEKYLVFGGNVTDPKMNTKLFDDITAPIEAKLGALGDKGDQIKKLLGLYKTVAGSTQGATFGLVVPTAAIGQGSLVKMITVMKADATTLMSAQEQMSQVQQELMGDLGIQGADLVKQTVTKDAKTVDGVHFDQIKSEVDPNANNGQAAQVQQAMQYIYGPDGQSVMLGAVNDKTVVQTMGLDEPLLAAAVAAAKADKDVLGGQVKSVDAELPKARSAVVYVDLAQFLTTGLNYAKVMGLNVPVQVPDNLPPLGVSVGSEPDAAAMRVDGFMPTSLMQSLIQAGFQIYLNVPHGGGGGGGF